MSEKRQNAVPDEVRRMVLREAETRYRNELMGDEERVLLWDRVQRIQRQLKNSVGVKATTT